ncbi:hypothetical protein HAX54_051465, partial [Datura stramonium]|nr:hypothetical protein [Datura stramonium]
FRSGTGATKGVTARYTIDGGFDGRQPDDGPSLPFTVTVTKPRFSGPPFKLNGGDEGPSGLRWPVILTIIWAILFQPHGGDDGPSG